MFCSFTGAHPAKAMCRETTQRALCTRPATRHHEDHGDWAQLPRAMGIAVQGSQLRPSCVSQPRTLPTTQSAGPAVQAWGLSFVPWPLPGMVGTLCSDQNFFLGER